MRAILMLHAVDASRSVLSLGARELESLLRAIASSGHTVVPLSKLLQEPTSPNRVALSFDDGFASVALEAAPILRRAGCTATLFLTTGYVGADNRWPSQPEGAPVFPMLEWKQVEALAASGWEIGAHTASHPDLRRTSDADLERELVEPLHTLEQRLGYRVQTFAYPYGLLDARVVGEVRRYYRYAVTTQMAVLGRGRDVDPHRIPRLDAYYLRSPRIHRRFGRADFRAYLRVRAGLRALRTGPGATGART